MSRFKITLVALFVIFELFLLAVFLYPGGMINDVSYRKAERLGAFRDYVQSHSAGAKAAFDHEMNLMHSHEDWKMDLALGLLVAINGAGVYYFLRYEHRKPAA